MDGFSRVFGCLPEGMVTSSFFCSWFILQRFQPNPGTKPQRNIDKAPKFICLHWHYWLVVGTPLKNMSSSVGMMTFPTEWKNKKLSKPPTRLSGSHPTLPLAMAVPHQHVSQKTLWVWKGAMNICSKLYKKTFLHVFFS